MNPIRNALAVGMFVVAVLGVGVPRADADSLVCAGEGTVLTPPMSLPVIGPPADGAFVLTISLGVCHFVGPIIGILTGWCGRAFGNGTADGHSFHLEVVGTEWVFSGQVVGVLRSDPTLCLFGATQFRIGGGLATQHSVTTPVTLP